MNIFLLYKKPLVWICTVMLKCEKFFYTPLVLYV